MKKKANELEFISQINRDGSGTAPVKKSYLKAMTENIRMKDEDFKLKRLSITEDTYIAFNFNAFVVRLKKSIKKDLLYRGISTINGDIVYGYWVKDGSYNYIVNKEGKTPVHPPSVKVFDLI